MSVLTTEAALRAAVNRLHAPSGALFEQEFRAAWEEAIQTESVVPMHVFLHRWAVWVCIERHPGKADRQHELERIVGTSEDVRARRAAAIELASMLSWAQQELERA
ncbi:DUF6247 family protein [Kitasatospora sp. NBC_01250]|uniref:DUF6247 family protein n=1 Tax=unclassified Kitasatospora TaxID=2633591 RepID=UPI002E1279A1|nr:MULTISPECIES: DUF6247 family protein [unclassified Kitasatospora]WSJ66955.1 DUF6247 family protein [Kitasatospora sp. NBC_01302]